MTRVCVTGGGPAGLTAAIFAARNGANVTLLEKNSRCGNKLLATGGGHCNVTNTRPETEWPKLFGKHGRFIVPALTFMPRRLLETWLTELGEPVHSPDSQHVFPQSASARAIRDALTAEAKKLGVHFRQNTRIRKLQIENNALEAVESENEIIPCDRTILAVGGKSYPTTGSTWDGAALAAQAGHRINPPFPGLVGLRADNLDETLAGLVLNNAKVSFKAKGTATVEDNGELLLTHGGISGPAVLDLSASVAQTLEKNGEAILKIAWNGNTGVAGWRERLAAWRQENGALSPASLLKGTLPQRLARWLCARAGVGENTAMARLKTGELENLAVCLGGYPARVIATEGWDKAMVTRGGVDVREIRPDTLESKMTKGLHFAGEMIDVDGPCGGYNLHWAFASGALAGLAAAK